MSLRLAKGGQAFSNDEVDANWETEKVIHSGWLVKQVDYLFPSPLLATQTANAHCLVSTDLGRGFVPRVQIALAVLTGV